MSSGAIWTQILNLHHSQISKISWTLGISTQIGTKVRNHGTTIWSCECQFQCLVVEIKFITFPHG